MFRIEKQSGLMNMNVKLLGMVFFGLVIRGILEESLSVSLRKDFPMEFYNQSGNETKQRRYCDPPNMTVLALYYDSSEEIEDIDYDFSQLQEMSFQAKLSHKEETEALLKKFYFWGTIISPIPASQIAHHIGPKKVFGYSLLAAGAASLLVPAACMSLAHFGIRFCEGIFHGAMLPTAHMLAVKWFPTHLRSSFVSCYSGIYVGYAIAELLTMQIEVNISQNAVIYLSSLTVVIWFLLWSIFVENNQNPQTHQREEKGIWTNTKGNPISKDLEKQIPWKHILCSRPVWMSVGVIFGTECGQLSVNLAMRQYLKWVYHVPNGFVLVLPLLIHSTFGILCGQLADYISYTQVVSNTSCRRMFVYISHFILAAFFFVISFVGCDATAPVVLYSLSVIVSGAAYAGAFCSALDIAPNFAGVILGLCCTFGAVGKIIISHFTSLVLDGMMPGSWRLTFSLTSLILLVSAIFFMLRGSGTVQIWNDSEVTPARMLASNRLSKYSLDSPNNILKGKQKLNVEKRILKVLRVQEPDKFTRVRAYSTSSPCSRSSLKVVTETPKYNDKKRASVS